MDLPMDGLMSGDFPNAFIPAVHSLFPRLAPLASPHAGSQEMGGPDSVRGLFSPGWRWDRASCHGSGVWAAPDCKAVPHPGCPGSLSPRVLQNGDALSLLVSSIAPGLSP